MRLEESVHLLSTSYGKILAACHEPQGVEEGALHGLTKRQVDLLELLDELEPVSVRQLAERMNVTSSTISIGIDKLARRGLVNRAPNKADRRYVSVTLSQKAALMRSSRQMLSRRLVVRLLESLTTRERETVSEAFFVLARASENLLELRRRS
jgi:DNA-binding MarR family transcriptional regulator